MRGKLRDVIAGAEPIYAFYGVSRGTRDHACFGMCIYMYIYMYVHIYIYIFMYLIFSHKAQTILFLEVLAMAD